MIVEYRETNAHLRANTAPFVSWFSFFHTHDNRGRQEALH
jgi:hypothetical protein